MPESTATSSAQTETGSPATTGKGGGGGALPKSEYPFVPQWLAQSRATTPSSRSVTPALNPEASPRVAPWAPGQGAGRFMGQPPAAAPQGAGGMMGGTPTATPVVRATQAGATFRPTITPSIYNEWKAYNARTKQQMYDNPPPMTPAETVAAFDRGEVSREKYNEALAAIRNEWHQDGAVG